MLWFKTQSQSNRLSESLGNLQTLCSKQSVFMQVKYNYKLPVLKSLAAKKQHSNQQLSNQQLSKNL